MTTEGYGARTKGIEGDLADKWFSAQKSLFVSAGKTFGDKAMHTINFPLSSANILIYILLCSALWIDADSHCEG